MGVAVDKSNNVYVADWNNDRVQKFTSTGSFLTALSVPDPPDSVAADSAGAIYVGIDSSFVPKFSAAGALVANIHTVDSDGSTVSAYSAVVDRFGYLYILTAGYNMYKYKPIG